MSPEAIDQRLRDLSQLYKLGMSIRGAEYLGSVEELRRQSGAKYLPTESPDGSSG